MRTPELETKRIKLRPLFVSDAEQIFKNWTSDPEVAKFMIWELHESVDDTITWLKTVEENYESRNSFEWGFVLKETGELFGSGGLYFKEALCRYELGYNIMRKYWNQGLTTEAGRAILHFALRELGVHKFTCRHAVDNIGSQKVMIKLGFKYYTNSHYESLGGKKQFECKNYNLDFDTGSTVSNR